MAKVDLGAIAARLFDDFLAPLVLGGELTPGKPIGGRAALALGEHGGVTDVDRRAHVTLVRIRVARRLWPVDRVGDGSPEEWALGACLHDLVQSAHPGLKGLLRSRAPDELLSVVAATLERIPAPANAFEALSRHTWFARLFEIHRTDTTVSWWTGSQVFLGEAPPPRLLLWPERRRVRVTKVPRSLSDLAEFGGQVDRDGYAAVTQRFLNKSPLTDLATLDRRAPAFQWSAETLGLVATRAGRSLVTRALRALPELAVSSALGRATRAIFPSLEPARAWPGTFFALALLGERVLSAAARALQGGEEASHALYAREDDDVTFARAAGALMARAELTQRGEASLRAPARAARSLAPAHGEHHRARARKASSYFLLPRLGDAALPVIARPSRNMPPDVRRLVRFVTSVLGPTLACLVLTLVMAGAASRREVLACDRAEDVCRWSRSTLSAAPDARAFPASTVRDTRFVDHLGKNGRRARSSLVFASGHEFALSEWTRTTPRSATRVSSSSPAGARS